MHRKELLFIDIETLGLDAQNNSMVSFGAVIVSRSNLEEMGSYYVKIKPYVLNEIEDPEARKLNGYNEEDWKDAFNIEDCILYIYNLMVNRNIGGHNIDAFDLPFIINAMTKHCNGKLEYGFSDSEIWYMRHNTIDTAKMAKSNGLFKEGYRPGFNGLGTLALNLGVANKEELKSMHNALFDARLSFKVYKAMREKGYLDG